jgi:tetratricopeptide (TPR) repeat protein
MWLRLPLVLLGLVTFTAFAAVDDDQELRNIEALIDAGETRLALNHVDRYVDRKPGDPRALFLKARAQEKAGRASKAAEIYERLIREYPHLPEPFINLAAIYVRGEQYEKARQLLVAALHTHSIYTKVYESLNNLHATMASQAYKNALLLDGEAVKPNLSTVSSLRSWSAEAPPETVAAARDDPVPPPADSSKGESVSSAGDSRVKPAPPITEPVKVASRPSSPANNGQLINKATPDPKRVALPSTPTPARDDRKELETTVKNWAEAWSRQEVGRYLSFYSTQFRPNAGLSRTQWKQQRRLRITAKKQIHVELSDFKTSVNGRTATVLFMQAYQSDTFSDVIRKKLILKRSAEGWKIIRETNAS